MLLWYRKPLQDEPACLRFVAPAADNSGVERKAVALALLGVDEDDVRVGAVDLQHIAEKARVTRAERERERNADTHRSSPRVGAAAGRQPARALAQPPRLAVSAAAATVPQPRSTAAQTAPNNRDPHAATSRKRKPSVERKKD